MQQRKQSENPIISSISGNIFRYSSKFTDYAKYCTYTNDSTAFIEEVKAKKEKFNKFFEDENPEWRGLYLADFLVKPFQRITRYPLLIREIIKVSTPKKVKRLKLALDNMNKVINASNEAVRELQAKKSNEQIHSILTQSNLEDDIREKAFFVDACCNFTKNSEEKMKENIAGSPFVGRGYYPLTIRRNKSHSFEGVLFIFDRFILLTKGVIEDKNLTPLDIIQFLCLEFVNIDSSQNQIEMVTPRNTDSLLTVPSVRSRSASLLTSCSNSLNDLIHFSDSMKDNTLYIHGSSVGTIWNLIFPTKEIKQLFSQEVLPLQEKLIFHNFLDVARQFAVDDEDSCPPLEVDNNYSEEEVALLKNLHDCVLVETCMNHFIETSNQLLSDSHSLFTNLIQFLEEKSKVQEQFSPAAKIKKTKSNENVERNLSSSKRRSSQKNLTASESSDEQNQSPAETPRSRIKRSRSKLTDSPSETASAPVLSKTKGSSTNVNISTPERKKKKEKKPSSRLKASSSETNE